MKEKTNKILNIINDKKELIYLISFSIFVLFCHLTFSVLTSEIGFLSTIISVIEWLVFGLFSLLILLEVFLFKTKKFTWLFCVAFVLSFFTIFITGNTFIVNLLILSMGLKNIKSDKIVKAWLIPTIIAFSFLVTLAVLEKIPNWTYERNEFKLRYSLGYSYPTPTASFFMFIVLAYIYLKKTNITFLELLLMSIAATLVYALTDSRTGWILTMLIIVGALIFKLLKNKIDISKFLNKKSIIFIVCLIPLVCILISLLLTYLYAQKVPFAISLNKVLSGRLKLQLQAFNNYSQSLFGQNIKWSGWGGYGYIVSTENFVYNYVDNSWIRMIFDYGIINTILYTFILSFSFYSILKQKDFWLLFTVLFFVVDTLIEGFLLNPGTCFIFIMFAMFLKTDKAICFKKEKTDNNTLIEEDNNFKNIKEKKNEEV